MFVPALVVWSGWLVLMAGANLATPLYAVYATKFGFSTLVLTLIFATYAVVLVPASFLTQIVSQRYKLGLRLSQAIGLALLAVGLLALVLASPLGSLALLVAGAVAAGVGHGLGFLNAQEELNDLAPQERRGEVTAAFIACIYFLVATSVIATGLLDLRLSLTLSVGAVALVLCCCAFATAGWQLQNRAHRTARRGV
jgi:Major Facilitator Superfamily